jgi:type IV pilus assembly protein PilP
VDLSQLKLVGIIRAQSGNRALVQEASGKGYIVTKGTYIGIRCGRVSEIEKDKVIVEEEDIDFSGEITTRTRELKLQRPPGEEYYGM